MNFLLAATIWALMPLLLLFVGSDILNSSDDFAKAYMDTHPFIHTVVIMEATADEGRLGNYHWVGLGSADFCESWGWMLVCMLGYIFMGIFFAWRAKCRFRKHIF
jgi:hypothetical protein